MDMEGDSWPSAVVSPCESAIYTIGVGLFLSSP